MSAVTVTQCRLCGGDGWVLEESHDEDGKYTAWESGCHWCGGTGEVETDTCSDCGEERVFTEANVWVHDSGYPGCDER